MKLIRRKRKLYLVMFILMLAMVALGSGCVNSVDSGQDPTNQNQQEDVTEITLYFSDNQAEKLVPEKREVKTEGKPLPEVVINELIKGPQGSGLLKTIPDGTVLLSLDVQDGLAQVDFSKDIKENHWGGSAGESMTIYSIVNSLAELEGIEEVQFMLEGEKMESLAGHFDLTQPISPNETMIDN